MQKLKNFLKTQGKMLKTSKFRQIQNPKVARKMSKQQELWSWTMVSCQNDISNWHFKFWSKNLKPSIQSKSHWETKRSLKNKTRVQLQPLRDQWPYGWSRLCNGNLLGREASSEIVLPKCTHMTRHRWRYRNVPLPVKAQAVCETKKNWHF